MNFLIEGKTHRYSFVYRNTDLTPEADDKLTNFIQARSIEKRVFLKRLDAAGINRYQTKICYPTKGVELATVVVVVIYGNHWQSFIELLVRYNDCFQSRLLPSISHPEYRHFDEERYFSDINEELSPL